MANTKKLLITATQVLAIAALVVPLLAGCGGASRASAPPASATGERSARTVLRELARCIRAHGLPEFPDPQVDNDGVARFPDSAPRVPVATQQACRRIAAQIPPDYSSTAPVSSGEVQNALALARCLRAHGIPDWPDPNALGQFPIDTRIQQGGKRLIEPALQACARLNPNPNGGVNVVRAHPSP
jgi:hypothetical protein